LDQTEPAVRPITIRHLMSHSSGLSDGLLDPSTLIFNAYNERKVLNPATTLAEMMDVLAVLPLVFHPGASWGYSVATDVLARLVEVISGQRFDAFIQSRILGPLGMVDTGFVVSDRDRLVAFYAGADAIDPMKPGLRARTTRRIRGLICVPSRGRTAVAGWSRPCRTLRSRSSGSRTKR
jgi:CubicO group peptidase (beta-lactamase class C family)